MGERLDGLDEVIRMLEGDHSEIVSRLDQAQVFSGPEAGQAELQAKLGQMKAELEKTRGWMLEMRARTAELEQRIAERPPPSAPRAPHAVKRSGAWAAEGWPVTDAQIAEAAERLVARIRAIPEPAATPPPPSGSVVDITSGSWNNSDSSGDPKAQSSDWLEPLGPPPKAKKGRDSDVADLDSDEWRS